MRLCRTALCQLLKPFKPELFYVIVLSLISNLMMLTPTIYMLQLYDRVMSSRSEVTLVTVTFIATFFMIVMAVAEWLRSKIVIYAGMRFDQLLGSKILNISLKQHQQLDPQQSNILMNSLTSVRQFVTGNGMFAFFDLPWSIVYIFILFVLSFKLGLLAIVFAMIQFLLALWNEKSTRQSTLQVIANQSRQQQFIQGKIRNLETIHVMGMLAPLYERWRQLMFSINQDEMNLQALQNRNQMVNKSVRYTMQSLMLAVASILVIRNEISVGSMIASNVLIARALQPFDVIVSTWQHYVQSESAASAIRKVLNRASDKKISSLTPKIVGNYTLNNIVLALHNTPIIKNLSLEIPTGKIVTMMGASGSGKSTLAKALVGIIHPTQGQLLLDDTLIQETNEDYLAQFIGYLPQDILLIEGTIAENIARFGQLNAQEIIRASQAVGLHDSILRLDKGYDTRLDEFGLPLSGGQRQLLGLARAIYKSPQILVLDEPNASLDEFGEQHLIQVLLAFKAQQKTVIVISHRKGLLQITDVLITLKSGELQQINQAETKIA